MNPISWQEATCVGFALHLIFDIGWQGKKVALGKRGVNRLMIYHAAKTSFFTLLPFVFIIFSPFTLFIFWLFLVASHILIDNGKIWLGQKIGVQYADYNWFWKLLALDQVAHLLALTLGAWWLT